jgi:CheY-like chemotaxis protein
MAEPKRILIIDDDPDALAYLQAILEGEGYEIVTAMDGDVGLEKVRETPPHLILLDLMMPKKSGTKFLYEIRQDERLKEIPIVVQSGARQATGIDMQHYLKEQPFRERKKEALGADIDTTPDAYLEKPIKPSDLLATIKKLL